jgi:hypothetical protein
MTMSSEARRKEPGLPKTEMLHREAAIRSKSPTAVNQALWGIFLAYNLVRLEMIDPPLYPTGIGTRRGSVAVRGARGLLYPRGEPDRAVR